MAKLASIDSAAGAASSASPDTDEVESDIVTNFFSLTQDQWSPEMFRRWSGIALVAGALERRVWVKTGQFITLPNLYTLLVGPPGTGKQVIKTVQDLWAETVEPGTREPAFHVAPDSMSKAALVDTLAGAEQVRLTSRGDTITYHCLLIAAEEFSVLMPSYDMEYVGMLNSVWNNPAKHNERRRYGEKQKVDIDYPMINLLGGVQPTFLSSNFPDEVWSTGLARRMIMAYSAETQARDPFVISVDQDELRNRIVKALSRLSAAQGQINWSSEATAFFRDWCLSGKKPEPSHTRLIGYNTSRVMTAIKLAAVSVMSRGISMVIELFDIQRALRWMFEAEAAMPDVFRAMVGRSDWQIIEELHIWAVANFNRFKGQPIEDSLIRQFLGERLPGDKVGAVFQLAESAKVIIRSPTQPLKFIPGATFARRVE